MLNNVEQAGDRDEFIAATLDKLLKNIQRNIDFHQDKSNPKLLELIEHFEQLADGNNAALEKLAKFKN